MKVAVIGNGKTGSKVIELLKGHQMTVFNRSNPVSVEHLQQHDIVITFTPGESFLAILPTLLEAKIPVVTGATGFDWPKGTHEKVKEMGLTWVHGHNFSFGMEFMKRLLAQVGPLLGLLPDYDMKVHEVHHVKKLDAPSGTAIKWAEWLEMPNVEITSERTGDVVGDHQVILGNGMETMTLRHVAHDRKLFANGAVWSAKKIMSENKLDTGILRFEDLVEAEFRRN